MMYFKRHLLAAAVLAGTPQLCACGDSSSDNEPPPSLSQPTSMVTKGLSGKTSDRHQANAIACLDVNQNNQCDHEEPQVRTDNDGRFYFVDLSNELDLSKIKVLFETITNENREVDNPTVTFAKGVQLTRPAGQTDYVSPLTSLLDTEASGNV